MPLEAAERFRKAEALRLQALSAETQGDRAEAAEVYRSAGFLADAARCLESAGAFDAAATC